MLQQVKLKNVEGKTVKTIDYSSWEVLIVWTDGTFSYTYPAGDEDDWYFEEKLNSAEIAYTLLCSGVITREECDALLDGRRAAQEAAERAQYEKLRAKFEEQKP